MSSFGPKGQWIKFTYTRSVRAWVPEQDLDKVDEISFIVKYALDGKRGGEVTATAERGETTG